jgi:hypothetical protein
MHVYAYMRGTEREEVGERGGKEEANGRQEGNGKVESRRNLKKNFS